MSQNWDMGGNTLIVEDIKVGATAPGQAGTSLSSTELLYLDGLTPGTATASKAVVLGSSKEIATITTATITNLTTTTLTPTTIAGGSFSSSPTLGTGTTINLDSNTATLSSNAATLTKYACVVTSEALTTAAGASQAFTLTLTGVAAGDLAFVTKAGGTNTRKNYQLEAVTTTDTVTVTLYNTEPTNAINGTVIFNLWVLKA
jgi:hypothetical protein